MNTEQRARDKELLRFLIAYTIPHPIREFVISNLVDRGWLTDEHDKPCELTDEGRAMVERALSQPASYQSATDSDGIGSKAVGAGEGFVCVGWEFNDPRDGMGWQRLHWLSPESVPPSEPPVEMRRVYVAAPTPPAAAQGVECEVVGACYSTRTLTVRLPAMPRSINICSMATIMLTSPDSGKEGA